MTEPTPDQIEAVSVALVDSELASHGQSEIVRHIARTYGRDIAVEQYGPAARAAILAYQETLA